MTHMFSQSVQAMFYLIIAAIASWQLASLSLLVSAVMILSLNRLLVASNRNAQLQTMRLRSLISRLTDSTVCLTPMKAIVRHPRLTAASRACGRDRGRQNDAR